MGLGSVLPVVEKRTENVMATAKLGYFLKDGATRVPSVTTILGRFKECGGLMNWAYECGRSGKDYREVRDSAANAGTMAHEAIEKWKKGEKVGFGDDDISSRAKSAYGAFLEWAEQTQLKITHTEVALVSEKYRFGGTLDAMLVSNKRSLGDWKTSNNVYGDYIAQVAAYGILWEENFPDEPIHGGYHLLRFDKEYGDFHHSWWAEVESAKKFFLHLREAYELDKELKKRAT